METIELSVAVLTGGAFYILAFACFLNIEEKRDFWRIYYNDTYVISYRIEHYFQNILLNYILHREFHLIIM